MGLMIDMYLRKKPERNIIESYVARFSDVEVECISNSKTVNILKKIRGRQSNFLCSCEGPYKIESCDVPEDIAKEITSLRWLLTLTLSHQKFFCRRFTKGLAKFLSDTFEGVAFNREKNMIIWPKKKRRKIGRSSKEALVNMIELRWFLPVERDIRSIGDKMIEICRDLSQEALPTRYGNFEPLQGRFRIEDKDVFLSAMEEECGNGKKSGLFFWKAKHPFWGGSLSRTPSQRNNANGLERISLALSFDSRALEYDDYQRLLQCLFVKMARDLCAFYGAGYVLRDYLAGRTLWSTAKTEQPPFPKGDVWLGLPDLPSWLTWYGSAYAPYVKTTLEGFISGHYPEGLFVAYENEPLNVDQLKDIAPRMPAELVLKREKAPTNIKHISELVAAGFKDIAFNPSGFMVGSKSMRADFIPKLGR